MPFYMYHCRFTVTCGSYVHLPRTACVTGYRFTAVRGSALPSATVTTPAGSPVLRSTVCPFTTLPGYAGYGSAHAFTHAFVTAHTAAPLVLAVHGCGLHAFWFTFTLHTFWFAVHYTVLPATHGYHGCYTWFTFYVGSCGSAYHRTRSTPHCGLRVAGWLPYYLCLVGLHIYRLRGYAFGYVHGYTHTHALHTRLHAYTACPVTLQLPFPPAWFHRACCHTARPTTGSTDSFLRLDYPARLDYFIFWLFYLAHRSSCGYVAVHHFWIRCRSVYSCGSHYHVLPTHGYMVGCRFAVAHTGCYLYALLRFGCLRLPGSRYRSCRSLYHACCTLPMTARLPLRFLRLRFTLPACRGYLRLQLPVHRTTTCRTLSRIH